MEVPANWLSQSPPHRIPHWTPQSHSSPVQWTFTFLIKNPWGYLMNYSPKNTQIQTMHIISGGGWTPQSPHTLLKLRHMPMTVRVLLLGVYPQHLDFCGEHRAPFRRNERTCRKGKPSSSRSLRRSPAQSNTPSCSRPRAGVGVRKGQ